MYVDLSGHLSLVEVFSVSVTIGHLAGMAVVSIATGDSDLFIEAIPIYGGIYAGIEEFQAGNPGAASLNIAIALADAFSGKIVGAAAAKLARGKRLIPGKPGMVIKGNADALRASMGTLPPGHQAHHLIPSALSGHKLIKEMGMDMNHFSNGMPLPEAVHKGFHRIYNDAMEVALDRLYARNLSVRDMQIAVHKLQNRARALIDARLPLYLNQGGRVDDWIAALTQ